MCDVAGMVDGISANAAVIPSRAGLLAPTIISTITRRRGGSCTGGAQLPPLLRRITGQAVLMHLAVQRLQLAVQEEEEEVEQKDGCPVRAPVLQAQRRGLRGEGLELERGSRRA